MGTDRRRGAARLAAVLSLLLAAPGCMTPRGLLYEDICLPLTTNMRGTPVGTKQSDLSTKEVRDPIFTGASVGWDSRAVGDIAKQNGFEEVHFADFRSFSILLGIFGQESVILSGR